MWVTVKEGRQSPDGRVDLRAKARREGSCGGRDVYSPKQQELKERWVS